MKVLRRKEPKEKIKRQHSERINNYTEADT